MGAGMSMLSLKWSCSGGIPLSDTHSGQVRALTQLRERGQSSESHRQMGEKVNREQFSKESPKEKQFIPKRLLIIHAVHRKRYTPKIRFSVRQRKILSILFS